MVGEQQVGSRAQAFQARAATLGAFDLQVDSLGAGGDGCFEHPQLLLDAAVETAGILMAAAGG